MSLLVSLSFAFVPLAWTVAAALYALALAAPGDGPGRWADRASRRAALVAALLHVGAFAAVTVEGVPPVASAGGLVSAVGLAGAVVYLWLERRVGSRATGVFPLACAAVLSAVGAGLGDPLRAVSPTLREPSAVAHVSAAVLGYAGLLLAALFGVLYLVQHRSMRARRFDWLAERLPSLELLDGFCRRSLYAALLFLTALIGFGHAVRLATDAAEPYDDPKVLATNGLWLLVGLVAAGLWRRVVPARVGAWAAIGLFVLAIVNLALVGRMSSWH